jgi:hypothetical protein
MPYKPKFRDTGAIAVPYFEIQINGKEIPERYYDMIQEVTYEDHETGSDTATIVATDPYHYFIDDPDIIKGAKVRIRGGWKGDLDTWLDGYISLVDLEFPETGSPTITITCMDQSFLLDRNNVTCKYTKLTVVGLAKIIAAKYKMKFVYDGPSVSKLENHDEISQADESDLKLLLRMIDDDELGLKVQNGTIYLWNIYGNVTAQDDLYWKEYPFNLRSFSSRLVIADKKKDKVIKSDVNNQKKIETGKGQGTNGAKDGKDTDVTVYSYDPTKPNKDWQETKR